MSKNIFIKFQKQNYAISQCNWALFKIFLCNDSDEWDYVKEFLFPDLTESFSGNSNWTFLNA